MIIIIVIYRCMYAHTAQIYFIFKYVAVFSLARTLLLSVAVVVVVVIVGTFVGRAYSPSVHTFLRPYMLSHSSSLLLGRDVSVSFLAEILVGVAIYRIFPHSIASYSDGFFIRFFDRCYCYRR